MFCLHVKPIIVTVRAFATLVFLCLHIIGFVLNFGLQVPCESVQVPAEQTTIQPLGTLNFY